MMFVEHIALWGIILTSASFVILFGSWIIDPKIWGADLGVERELQNRLGGVITIILLSSTQIPIIVLAISKYNLIYTDINFVFALLVSYLIYQVFNLMDLIVFDWLIYMKLKPKFMRPDYLPLADNFKKHFKDFLNGIFIAVIPATIATTIWYFFI